MFETVREELKKASEHLGRDDILRFAPVYLFDNKDGCSLDLLDSAGEELAASLEEEGILDPLHDAFVLLSVVQQYKLSEKTRFEIGLNDRYDNFAYSLGEWIELLSIRHHISKGIIYINIDDCGQLGDHREWWRSLLRSVNLYRSSFVFIFGTTENTDKLKAEIGRYHNCRIISSQRMECDKLLKLFLDKVSVYGLELTYKAKREVRSVIKTKLESITPNTILLWAEHISWEHMISDTTEETKSIISDTEIDASFTDNIESREDNGNNKQIGF